MSGPSSTVVRVHFEAEMGDGYRYVMDLDPEGCTQVVAIGWGNLLEDQHIWETLYRGRAALLEDTDPMKARLLDRAASFRTVVPIGPEPKPVPCDRFWEWIKNFQNRGWDMNRLPPLPK